MAENGCAQGRGERKPDPGHRRDGCRVRARHRVIRVPPGHLLVMCDETRKGLSGVVVEGDDIGFDQQRHGVLGLSGRYEAARITIHPLELAPGRREGVVERALVGGGDQGLIDVARLAQARMRGCEVGLILSALIRRVRQQDQAVLLDPHFGNRDLDRTDLLDGGKPVDRQSRRESAYRGRITERQPALSCRDQRKHTEQDRQGRFDGEIEPHGAFGSACFRGAGRKQKMRSPT